MRSGKRMRTEECNSACCDADFAAAIELAEKLREALREACDALEAIADNRLICEHEFAREAFNRARKVLTTIEM